MDTTIMQKAINTIAKRSNDEELRVCPHCGTKYAWFNKSTNSINIHVQVPACDCQERIEKEKEAAKIAEAKKEKLAKIFENSMMTPLFQEKVFSSLKETEHFDLCKKYAAEFNPKTAEGILMIGNVGTGKTTLLAAICNELMNKGFNCLFTTLSALLDKFSKYSYDNAGDITPLLQWLVSFDFVVLDDIGRETYNDKRKEVAFRIIDSLLNYKTTTALTANPEMIKKLQALPEWKATLDRLKDTCGIHLQFTGKSMRGEKW